MRYVVRKGEEWREYDRTGRGCGRWLGSSDFSTRYNEYLTVIIIFLYCAWIPLFHFLLHHQIDKVTKSVQQIIHQNQHD